MHVPTCCPNNHKGHGVNIPYHNSRKCRSQKKATGALRLIWPPVALLGPKPPKQPTIASFSLNGHKWLVACFPQVGVYQDFYFCVVRYHLSAWCVLLETQAHLQPRLHLRLRRTAVLNGCLMGFPWGLSASKSGCKFELANRRMSEGFYNKMASLML